MTIDIIESIAVGVARREYSILMGAGASASATSLDGRPLPTTPILLDELGRVFELPDGAVHEELPAVFQWLRVQDAERLCGFLRDRFHGCKPSDAHRRIVRLPWERIWTLNVDDVLETAAIETGTQHTPIYLSHNRAAFAEPDAVEIVHLHGAVTDLLQAMSGIEDPYELLDRVILDRYSYGRLTHMPATWNRRFEDDFADKPFVTIGARVVDEIDFWRMCERLRGASPNQEYPSTIVLSEVSPFHRTRLESEFGLQVLELTMDNFTTQLETAYLQVLSTSSETLGAPVRPVDIRFLQQFDDLRRRSETDRDEPARVRFYQGWEPTWPVIRDQHADATFEGVRRRSAAIVDDLGSTDPKPRVHLFTGGPGTGKTTALLRVASDALDAGYSPWLFRADERLDVDSAVEWSSKHHGSLLLVDDVPDFIHDVTSALRMANEHGTRMYVVATARSPRVQYTTDTLEAAAPPIVTPLGTMIRSDVATLIGKLEAAGLLGKLTSRTSSERERFFLKEHQGRIFSALAEVTEGPGFEDRIVSTFGRLTSSERAVLAPVALTHNFGHSLKATIIARTAGLTPGEVSSSVHSGLSGLLTKTRSGLTLTHQVVASLFLQKCFTKEERFRLALDLATHLAPHVDRRELANRSREARLARVLMLAENVDWLMGSAYAERYYASLEGEYGWNGRFWDQRAKWYFREGDLGLARTYAERSVAVHPHAYPLTLLGQILMEFACRTGKREYLRDAEDALRRTRDGFRNWYQWDEDTKPFETFFDGMIRYRAQWGGMPEDSELLKWWRDWVNRARDARVPSVRDRLDEWQREWDSS